MGCNIEAFAAGTLKCGARLYLLPLLQKISAPKVFLSHCRTPGSTGSRKSIGNFNKQGASRDLSNYPIKTE